MTSQPGVQNMKQQGLPSTSHHFMLHTFLRCSLLHELMWFCELRSIRNIARCQFPAVALSAFAACNYCGKLYHCINAGTTMLIVHDVVGLHPQPAFMTTYLKWQTQSGLLPATMWRLVGGALLCALVAQGPRL
jgi:hypothetical protein